MMGAECTESPIPATRTIHQPSKSLPPFCLPVVIRRPPEAQPVPYEPPRLKRSLPRYLFFSGKGEGHGTGRITSRPGAPGSTTTARICSIAVGPSWVASLLPTRFRAEITENSLLLTYGRICEIKGVRRKHPVGGRGGFATPCAVGPDL